MKLINSTAWMVLMVLQTQMVLAQTVTISSFEEAWSYTQENSPILAMSKTEVERAGENVKMTRSSLLPQVNFSANFQDNLDLPVTLIPGELTGRPPGTFVETQFGKKYSYTANLSANWEVINVGNWFKLRASKIQEEISQFDRQVQQEQLKEQLATLYHLSLLSREAWEIALENQHQSDHLLQLAEEKRGQGVLDEISYNKIRINNREIGDNALKNEEAWENNLVALRRLMGIKTDQEIELVDTLEGERDIQMEKPSFSVSPELQAKWLEQNLAETALKESKAAYLPTLSLYGNFSYQQFSDNFQMDFSETNSWNPANSFGLRLNIPVFSGGYRNAQVSSQKLNMQMASLSIKEFSLAEQEENQKVWNSYLVSTETWQNAQEILQLHQQNVALSTDKLDKGVISMDEHLETFMSFLNAQNLYLNRLADFLIASVELQLKTAE